ncbi:hypothetical protein Rhein_0037 [Rheinheimera sp. A13L]|nr:hypothetical protein Rhein_0037 [Rheinheimera sp. A13L]
MNPLAYCIIISIILSIFIIHTLNNLSLFISENTSAVVLIFIISVCVSLGALLGFFLQKNKYLPSLRPIVYWPLIGALLGLIIKGSGNTGLFICICITTIVGIIFERKRGKITKQDQDHEV